MMHITRGRMSVVMATVGLMADPLFTRFPAEKGSARITEQKELLETIMEHCDSLKHNIFNAYCDSLLEFLKTYYSS